MPGILIRTSAGLEERKEELFAAVTKMVVEAAGKKEAAVMVMLEKVEGRKGNKPAPVAFVEVRSMVGLDHAMNHRLSEGLCKILADILGINGADVYINFMRIPETMWGQSSGICIWDHPQGKWVIR